MTTQSPAKAGHRTGRKSHPGHSGNAGRTARRASNSRAVEVAARLGFAGRGLVYVLIGVLAVGVAFGLSGERTDRQGALRQVADAPFGTAVLVLLVIGFFGYALWRFLEAAVGGPDTEDSDGKKRAAKRLVSAGRGAIYTAIAISTLVFLTSGGSRGASGEPAPYTARVMGHTGGRWLVGIVGVVVVGIGIGMIVRGVKISFEKHLRTEQMPPGVRHVTQRVGQAGYIARGVVFGLAGVFVVKAAVDFDPAEAKGFDGTLKTIVDQAYGQWLLTLCALGLVLFGAYSFLESRYRKI